MLNTCRRSHNKRVTRTSFCLPPNHHFGPVMTEGNGMDTPRMCRINWRERRAGFSKRTQGSLQSGLWNLTGNLPGNPPQRATVRTCPAPPTRRSSGFRSGHTRGRVSERAPLIGQLGQMTPAGQSAAAGRGLHYLSCGRGAWER